MRIVNKVTSNKHRTRYNLLNINLQDTKNPLVYMKKLQIHFYLERKRFIDWRSIRDFF